MKKLHYGLVGIILVLSAIIFSGQATRRDLQIIYPEQSRDYRIRSADLLNAGYQPQICFLRRKRSDRHGFRSLVSVLSQLVFTGLIAALCLAATLAISESIFGCLAEFSKRSLGS